MSLQYATGNIDGIVSRCAFDRTDDYIVVVTCNLLSNIKTDVIIMVIMIVYFIIAARGSGRILRNLQSRRMRECMSVRQNTTVKREKTGENCRLHINALTKLYTKVLIINLTQNSYQIVSIDRESLKNSVFSAKLSDWFATFANSDELHPDDRQAFLQKTALQNLKKEYQWHRKVIQHHIQEKIWRRV